MARAKTSLAKQRSFQQVSRPGRRRLLKVGELLLWTVALLIPACGGFYRYAYYQQFRRGTCTIADSEVTSQDVSSRYTSYTAYYAHFSYLVAVPGTRGIAAQGYDAPDHTSFSSVDEAQNVVDQYPIGRVTACWYNQNNPTEAALVFHGYSLERAWTTFWIALLVTGAFDVLPILAWYDRVRLSLTLRERGRVTKGVVERREKNQSQTGVHTIAVISYTAISFENQHVKGTLHGPGYLRKKERVPVCYDPYRPHKALRGGRPTQASLVSWAVLALVLLVIITVMASFATYQLT